MKIAIVHDYLNQYGGAERCLEVFHKLFPEAPIFTLIYDANILPQYKNWDIRTSFIQRLPFAKQSYRNFMLFFPRAMKSFKLDEFDLVISVTHAWGKGIRTNDKTYHICFCLTPVRYFWDLYQDYRRFYYINPIIRALLPLFVKPIRKWDVGTSKNVDYFISISRTVADRIKKFYNRESTLIYPPIDTSFFSPANAKSANFYLTVSRLKEYKRVEIIVKAFNQLNLPLKIIGIGSLLKKLKQIAAPNIDFLGAVSDKELLSYYQNCRAFVFAGKEDFGLVSLEAQACGKPIIAFGQGGLSETVVEGQTGTLFYKQTPQALIEAVERFEKMDFDPEQIRNNVLKFDRTIFEKKITSFIQEKFEEYKINFK